jgi:hypothetical protein
MRRTLTLVLAVVLMLVAFPTDAPGVGSEALAVAPVLNASNASEETGAGIVRPGPSAVPNTESSRPPQPIIPVPLNSDDASLNDRTDTASDGSAEDAAQDAGAPEPSFLVATVPAVGAIAGTGTRWRYTIEVESSLGMDVEVVAEQIRIALHDERSWARTRTLEQVADPGVARIRIVLASPATVDALCARAGLRTAGIYSCWNGRVAALNAWRWDVGAVGFDDVATYRTYLVNHEFGHGLGYGHVSCPGTGSIAPVMMQQSKGLGACVANGWPYP